jgi:hypothetical protein
MKTIVYIDGFNLYYGAVKGTPYRWLNLSDLFLPIQFVVDELHKPVGLLNPQKNPSAELSKCVTFLKRVRAGVLARSQFSPTLTDRSGTFSKPASW